MTSPAPTLRLVPAPERPSRPCSVPGGDHEGRVRLYPEGLRCEKHAPPPAVTRVPATPPARPLPSAPPERPGEDPGNHPRKEPPVKIKVTSKGETEFAADSDYAEPAIREALKAAAAANDPRHVALTIIDYTDTERSDIDHDQHATVTEDDGTYLWSGWLDGAQRPDPDAERDRLAGVRERLENLAAGMELSAQSTSPSKKSEIERGCAEAVRGIAAGLDGA